MGLFDKLKNLVTEGAEVEILEPTGTVDLTENLPYRVRVTAKRDLRITKLSVYINRRQSDFGGGNGISIGGGAGGFSIGGGGGGRGLGFGDDSFGGRDSSLGSTHNNRVASDVRELIIDMRAGEQREFTGALDLAGLGHILGSQAGRRYDEFTQAVSMVNDGRRDSIRYHVRAAVQLYDSVNDADTGIEIDIVG